MAWQHQSQPPQSKQSLFRNSRLPEKLTISLIYHDIFGYPLKHRELNKWQAGEHLKMRRGRPQVEEDGEYLYIKGRGGLVEQRLKNEFASRSKLETLSRAKKIFDKDKNILMVAITGSLAMVNASTDSDIDLFVITRQGKLWQTRLKTLIRLKRAGIATRSAGKSKQKDMLCTNMWFDVSELKIDNENPYTAHELAQIVPVINKERTYEKLLSNNRWVLDYWPNSLSVELAPSGGDESASKANAFLNFFESAAYFLQKAYMRRKQTREVVSPARAMFHPEDWSAKVKRELENRGVYFD